VSTEDQVNVFEGSLESQKYRIQEFVDYKNRQAPNWGEVVEWYVEEGVSAGTTNRPMYQKIMNDIRKGKVNLILVSDLTRLSRNLLDFCNLINELEKHKASYLSMKEQFDTSTPIGRMMVFIIIALGQFEREQTSERVSINAHSRALRGFVNGGPALLGYDKHPEKKGMLIVNDSEAKTVETIFQIFLETGSRAKTIEKLKTIGIAPKRTSKRAKAKGSAEWTVQSLGSILNNIAYIGQREINKIYKDEDSAYLKPWQKHQIVKAAWPAILKEEVFLDAQKLIKEASEKERARQSKSEKRTFLLTGIIHCAETGLPLVGQVGHGSSGTVHKYYHYVRKPKDLEVIRPRLNAEELEEKLLTEFKTAVKTAGYFEDLEKLLTEQYEAKSKKNTSEYTRTRNQLNEITARIKMIWTNQGQMQLNAFALKLASEELNQLAKEKEHLEKYLNQMDFEDQPPISAKSQVLFVENQIRMLLHGWQKATPAMRKRLLRRTVKEIYVTRGEMNITFWLSAEERNDAILEGDSDPLQAKKILAFRDLSSQSQDSNFYIASSGNVRNGRPLKITCKFLQQHDFTEYFEDSVENIFAQTAPLYEKGYSLKEISAMTGFPYTTIRDQLIKGGVSLRINKSVSSTEVLRQSFKNSAPPPFGYGYFDGILEKDPKEYPILQMIDQLRRRGETPTAIANKLNDKKIKTRKGNIWKQATVYTIIQRLKDLEERKSK